MRETVRNKCDLFADNYKELSKKFKWGYTINNKLGSLLYSMDNRAVDTDAISRCRKIIKDNTGVFSQFKDITNFTVSVMLSLHSEPEAVFKGALTVYNFMKLEGFHASHYLVIAATSIAQKAEPYYYQQIVREAKNHYTVMKEEHPWITSCDDYGFAALLALAQKPVSQSSREMKNCYRLLKESFSFSNAVQALAEVLVFSEEETAAKCKRVYELSQALKRRKCKLGPGMELSFLGVLALLKANSEQLADEIAEATQYLKNKKGFGYWSVTSRERVLFASALVCNDYLGSMNKEIMEMTINNNIIEIIVAQQVATIAAASASATAASSAT
ncbi:MAG TPA: DUF4003 family protein [Mobilitalea sp.]|nr:DUF4003 family protein [Mobilitalea sp.]